MVLSEPKRTAGDRKKSPKVITEKTPAMPTCGSGEPLWITLAQHFLKTRPFKMRSWIGCAPWWRGDVRVAYAFLDRIRIQDNQSELAKNGILRVTEILLIGAFEY